MKKITLWVRTFTNSKSGQKFAKASILGAYVPKAAIRHNSPIKQDEYYDVKLVGMNFPTDLDGEYNVFFVSGWVDDREQTQGDVIRLKGDDANPILIEFLRKSNAKK